MNMDTVLKCAQIAAQQRMAALGRVDEDIAELLAELTPAPVVEAAPEPEPEPVAETAPAPEAEAQPEVPSAQ